MYHSSESFQSICESYQKCSEALEYWSKSDLQEAYGRRQEYAELIKELELEILQSLEEGF